MRTAASSRTQRASGAVFACAHPRRVVVVMRLHGALALPCVGSLDVTVPSARACVLVRALQPTAVDGAPTTGTGMGTEEGMMSKTVIAHTFLTVLRICLEGVVHPLRILVWLHDHNIRPPGAVRECDHWFASFPAAPGMPVRAHGRASCTCVSAAGAEADGAVSPRRHGVSRFAAAGRTHEHSRRRGRDAVAERRQELDAGV
jgi:hypothetical protein